jgi:two-component system NarL family response regulator
MAGERILLIEDESRIREMVKEYLENEGFVITEAVDGADGLDKFKSLEFDMMVLDIMLPKVDGWSVCREVRRTSLIPILMLSARGEEYDRLFGFELGVDDYIVKPFSPKELVARMKAVLLGEAQDGMEAVEKVRTLVPDVVLMDVSMPRMGGVEATRQIKREFPHIGVVALTMYDEQQYIFDLVRAGATGYLLKDSESSQIVAAIRAIYKGESLIHPSVASKILAEFSLMSQKKGKKPGWVEHDLTEREITVLRLVADGKTNKEIANNLDLSEKTVKNHVRNIFHKLQVYDRTQAAILAIRKGLIELDPRP